MEGLRLDCGKSYVQVQPIASQEHYLFWFCAFPRWKSCLCPARSGIGSLVPEHMTIAPEAPIFTKKSVP